MGKITCTFATGLVGLFLLLMGLGFLWFGTKSIIRMWAWEKLTLKNNSEAMDRWIHPPQPILLRVYIFNVTNAEEVSEGALPIFSEVGPYVYQEVRFKVNVTRYEEYKLSYRLRNNIRFDQSLSGRFRETDMVTVLNVPLAGAILLASEAVPEFLDIPNNIWRFFFPGQRNIFIKTPVKDLLFDGINIDCSSKLTRVYIACRALAIRKTYSVRKEGKNFKFSFFWARNGTSSETFQVDMGVLNIRRSAQFISINDSPSIRKWKDPYCDMINGSDGSQFPILFSKNQSLYMFDKELCRSVYARFEKSFIKNGVTLYKYSNTADLFASPDRNPDNRCFCRSALDVRDVIQGDQEARNDTGDRRPEICFGNGVLPLMPCVGAPIVVSFPHFYLGDETYMNFSGLYPVKELHETYVAVEPNSGMAVMGCKRIQFNLEVKKIEDVDITSNLAEGLFPILWVEERHELSEELFKLLRYTLIEKKILENGTFVLIAAGIFLIVLAYVVRFLVDQALSRRKKKAVDVSFGDGESYLKKLERTADGRVVLGGLQVPRTDHFLQRQSIVNNFM